MGIKGFLEFEVTKLPIIEVKSDQTLQDKIDRIIDYLEESDDVLRVYTNIS